MENLIKEIYNIGNEETKRKLEKEYPNLFKKSLLEQAINHLTEKDEEVIKLRKLETLEGIDNLIAEQKLVIIYKFKNDGWVAEFKTGNTKNHFIWWDLSKEKISCYHCHCSYSNSNVPASLCLKSSELCKELGNNEEVTELANTYYNKL